MATSPALLALIEEIKADLAYLEPLIEGHEDFIGIDDLMQPALNEMGAYLQILRTRRDADLRALELLGELSAQRFPELPPPVFSPETAIEVAQQRKSIDLAAELYKKPEAARLVSTATTTPKQGGSSRG